MFHIGSLPNLSVYRSSTSYL